MAKKRQKQARSPIQRLLFAWHALPVRDGGLALLLINLAVLLTGLESAWVQTITSYRRFTPDLLLSQPFWLLLCLDLLAPLIVALLSRRVFFVYLAGQCFLGIILLHYTIFFYNPLTLSTIYHSMQGAASLGFDIFAFARPGTMVLLACLFAFKVLLVQLSNLPDALMPRFWHARGITAVGCMAVVWLLSSFIYGKTGLSLLWIDSRGHRTATERRLEQGTSEAVHNIGYIATWIGEFLSGTYKDIDLIYAEGRCRDPEAEETQGLAAGPPLLCPPDPFTPAQASGQTSGQSPDPAYGPAPAPAGSASWQGLPLPPLGDTLVFIQAESLDFAALGMRVNGHQVTPFLNHLMPEALLLKAFAPHKVGSSNADYEILNGRSADQNVIYYSYIKAYPDSVIAGLSENGFETSLFHGLEGELFNLREAYRNQGFRYLTFKEELEREGYYSSGYIMGHIKDEDVFDLAAGRLMPDKRQFQFIITMSSHIPFIDALPIFRDAGGAFARYVSGLRYLDQCLAAYYAQLPAGAVLVIWGDHGSDVVYPRGFVENSRHVPFIVNVKGNTDWMAGVPTDKNAPFRRPPDPAPDTAPEYAPDSPTERRSRLELLAEETQAEDFPVLANPRVYTLCELAYFLRRLLP